MREFFVEGFLKGYFEDAKGAAATIISGDLFKPLGASYDNILIQPVYV